MEEFNEQSGPVRVHFTLPVEILEKLTRLCHGRDVTVDEYVSNLVLAALEFGGRPLPLGTDQPNFHDAKSGTEASSDANPGTVRLTRQVREEPSSGPRGTGDQGPRNDPFSEVEPPEKQRHPVENCPRCKGKHRLVTFRPFQRPVCIGGEVFWWWWHCPETDEPAVAGLRWEEE